MKCWEIHVFCWNLVLIFADSIEHEDKTSNNVSNIYNYKLLNKVRQETSSL